MSRPSALQHFIELSAILFDRPLAMAALFSCLFTIQNCNASLREIAFLLRVPYKNEDLIYNAAEAWNNTHTHTHTHACLRNGIYVHTSEMQESARQAYRNTF
jgi:hypothetical protein